MTQRREGTTLNGYCITGNCDRCPVTTVLSQTGVTVTCSCHCHT